MQRNDAMRALDIYRRAGQQVTFLGIFVCPNIDCCLVANFVVEIYILFVFQAERLSEFYEICKNLDIGRGERFIKIEQVGCLTCGSVWNKIFLVFEFFIFYFY
jgi:hypothetical protein